MTDLLDGRMDTAMPSDRAALHEGTKSVFLWTMSFWIFVPTAHAAYLLGVHLGTYLS